MNYAKFRKYFDIFFYPVLNSHNWTNNFSKLNWFLHVYLNNRSVILRFEENVIQNLKSVWKWMFLYKWPLYDLFWPFFHHMCVYLSQNWGSDGHFEVLNGSKSWLGKKLWSQMYPEATCKFGELPKNSNW